MIDSFASGETKKIFLGNTSTKLPKDIQRTARRKLIYLDDAEDLQDLLAPPGNRLEKLKGGRLGSLAFASMINGVFASSGLITKPKMLRLLIIIR